MKKNFWKTESILTFIFYFDKSSIFKITFIIAANHEFCFCDAKAGISMIWDFRAKFRLSGIIETFGQNLDFQAQLRLSGKIESFVNLTFKDFGIVMQANMTTTNNNDQKVRIQNRGIRDQLGLLQYKLEPRCFLFIMTTALGCSFSHFKFPSSGHSDILCYQESKANPSI